MGHSASLPIRFQSYAGRGNYEDYQPLQDQLYFSQAKIIKELAEKGPCVIVGRCADYILRDRKDVLNVFIHADMEFKKKHCMERRQFPEGNAEDMIRRRDKLRADHYRYYTDQKWGDSFHYHLCLDSSMFGIVLVTSPAVETCLYWRRKMSVSFHTWPVSDSWQNQNWRF